MNIDEAMESLNLKFTSGNDIPVDRSTITREEYEVIKTERGITMEKSKWKQYKRKGLSEMRPYVLGEDMTGISVSSEDDPYSDMGMIARNPKNHEDMWYVARKYFEENLEPV